MEIDESLSILLSKPEQNSEEIPKFENGWVIETIVPLCASKIYNGVISFDIFYLN